jgi:BON domain
MRSWSFTSGVLAGAGLAYFLDPNRGARRRALVRDRAVRAGNKVADAAGATARDVAHRAQGVAAETRALLHRDTPPDDVLGARVRAKLGRYSSHPRAITVTGRDGVVTLEGPILASEAQGLMRAVCRIRGVTDVENRLEVHDEPGDHPALQGGVPRPGERLEFFQQNWAPAARLCAGAAGIAAAAYALRRLA